MGDEFTTLHQFDLSSGGVVTQSLLSSFEGVRTPEADYEEGLIAVGPITRAIGPGSEPYTLGSVSVQLHNTDRRYSKLLDGHRFIGRDHTLKFGRLSDGLAAAKQLFAGRIIDHPMANAVMTLESRDTGADRFYKPVRSFAKTLNVAVFPDLPAGRPEALANILYGDVSTNGGNMVGAGPIPCYRIDEDAGGKWRYLVAQHVCKAVTTVYIYGVVQGSGFTVTTASYGGVTMQVIDFDADPRSSTRPYEVEVTVLAKGITDDGTSGGNLIENPVEQRDHFLQNYAGWDSSEIDSTLSTAAAAACDNNILNLAAAPYKTCMLIGGDLNVRVVDVLNKLTVSCLLYTWMTRNNKVGAYCLTLSEATNPPSPAFTVEDRGEIIERSFGLRGNRGAVYSRIDSQRVYNWTLGRYAVTAAESTPIAIRRRAPMAHNARKAPLPHTGRKAPLPFDAGTSTAVMVGDEDTPDAPPRLVSMEYVADPDTSQSVTRVYGLLADGRVRFVTLDLPCEFLLNPAADLNRYIGVTHWQGVSAAGGYENAVFRIVRTEDYLQPTQKKLRLTCMKLAV